MACDRCPRGPWLWRRAPAELAAVLFSIAGSCCEISVSGMGWELPLLSSLYGRDEQNVLPVLVAAACMQLCSVLWPTINCWCDAERNGKLASTVQP